MLATLSSWGSSQLLLAALLLLLCSSGCEGFSLKSRLLRVERDGTGKLQTIEGKSRRSGQQTAEQLIPQSISVKASIRNRMANSNLTLVSNPDSTRDRLLEARFKIPPSAMVNGLRLEAGGQVYTGVAKTREEAAQDFQDSVGAGQSASLVDTKGYDYVVQVNVAASEVLTITVSYEEYLDLNLGVYGYFLHLDTTSFVPLPPVDVAISLQDDENFLSIQIPKPEILCGYQSPTAGNNLVTCSPGAALTDKAYVRFFSLNQAEVRLQLDHLDQQNELLGGTPGKGLFLDFNLRVSPVAPATPMAGGSMLIDQDGHFVHEFRPPVMEPMKKAVVLMIDKSGSMDSTSASGGRTKWEQANEAVKEILNSLDPEDIFSLGVFDSYVQSYMGYAMINATEWNVDDALGWMEYEHPNGGTNIEEGIIYGLNQFDSLFDQAMHYPVYECWSDSHRSGWWQLLGGFSIVSALLLLCLMFWSIVLTCSLCQLRPMPMNMQAATVDGTPLPAQTTGVVITPTIDSAPSQREDFYRIEDHPTAPAQMSGSSFGQDESLTQDIPTAMPVHPPVQAVATPLIPTTVQTTTPMLVDQSDLWLRARRQARGLIALSILCIPFGWTFAFQWYFVIPIAYVAVVCGLLSAGLACKASYSGPSQGTTTCCSRDGKRSQALVWAVLTAISAGMACVYCIISSIYFLTDYGGVVYTSNCPERPDPYHHQYTTPKAMLTHAKIVLLLTDGQATAGERDPFQLSKQVAEKIEDLGTDIQIFGIAFGRGADLDFLQLVSAGTGAGAIRIYEDNDMDVQVKDFFDQLGQSAITELRLTYTAMRTETCAGGPCEISCTPEEVLESCPNCMPADDWLRLGPCQLSIQRQASVSQHSSIVVAGKLPPISFLGTRAQALKVTVEGLIGGKRHRIDCTREEQCEVAQSYIFAGGKENTRVGSEAELAGSLWSHLVVREIVRSCPLTGPGYDRASQDLLGAWTAAGCYVGMPQSHLLPSIKFAETTALSANLVTPLTSLVVVRSLAAASGATINVTVTNCTTSGAGCVPKDNTKESEEADGGGASPPDADYGPMYAQAAQWQQMEVGILVSIVVAGLFLQIACI